MAKVRKYFLIPLSIGIILTIVGVVMITVIFPNITEKEIIKNVVLEKDTIQWYRFKTIPFPFNFKVYLFTVENKNEVLAGEIPRVKQVGPFVYKEIRDKNMFTSGKKDQIKYSDVLKYTFDKIESGKNSEEDNIVFLNAPLIAIMQSLEILPFSLGIDIEEVLKDIFTDTSIFIDVKVKDLTFGGIKMCHKESAGGWAQLLCLVIMLMNQKLIEYHYDLSMSFSLFKYKTKEDGPFTLNNGVLDVNKLGLISSYKNQEYTSFWAGDKSQCDTVNGYFTTFPPFMEEGSEYPIYSTDICKPITIKQTYHSSYKSIPSYKFETSEESLVSDTDDCVCINATKGLQGENRCFRNSTLDMNTCMGVPVVLSFPHLMWADKDLQDSVIGLKYSEEDHKTMIDFEPHLGYPVKGNIRLQFNMILRPMTFDGEIVPLSQNLPRSVFPMLWVDDNFVLTDELVDEIDTKLLSLLSLAEIVQWTILGVGVFVAVLSVALLLFCRKS